MIVVPFKKEHVAEIDQQEQQAIFGKYITEDHLEALENSQYAFTGITDRVIACAGVLEYWSGRGEAWALLSKSSGREFIYIHNAVKRFLDVCPLQRIEATVDENFSKGHQWIKLLGFIQESIPMKHYYPNGGSAILYSRIKWQR